MCAPEPAPAPELEDRSSIGDGAGVEGTRAAAEPGGGDDSKHTLDTLGSVGELDALARIIPRLPPSEATIARVRPASTSSCSDARLPSTISA